MNAHLTPEQTEVLLRPIRPGRVASRDGQSNVEAYDIRAHLTRIFGFGRWDEIAVGSRLLYEEAITLKNGKDGYKVGYSADRCIRVRDQDGNLLCEHHGSAIGEAQMPAFKRGDCHDFALKKAQSQALKRAAINLGDQFGLSLYRGGSLDPVVGKVVGSDTVMHEPDVVEETDPDEAPAELPDTDSVVSQSTLPLETPETGEDVPIRPDSGELMVSDAQVRKIQTVFGRLEVKDRAEKLRRLVEIIGREIGSSKEMTKAEAHRVIEALESQASERAVRTEP